MKALLRPMLSVAICATALLTGAQAPTFPDLADRKDVTTVFVSKAMLNSLGKNPGDIKQFSIKDMAKSIKTLEIITCEEKAAVREAKKALKSYVKSNSGLETLAKVKDDGEEMVVYGIPTPGDDCYSEIVMSTLDDSANDMQLIVIKGNISMKDLSKFRMNPGTESSTTTVIHNGDITVTTGDGRYYRIPRRIQTSPSGKSVESLGTLDALNSLDSLKSIESLKSLDSLKNLKPRIGSKVTKRSNKSRKNTMKASKVDTQQRSNRTVNTTTAIDSNGHRIIRSVVTDEKGNETIYINQAD